MLPISSVGAAQRVDRTDEASGAIDSFTRLFHAEFAYVHASLRRLGVTDRDVEDVTHEVFLQIHAKLATYDTTRPLRPWLFGFCFRAASDYRRLARHRRELFADAHEPTDPEPLADESVARRQEAALVAAALNEIDLERRAVLVAYELDECPMKEIAATLSIPLATAYSRLRVAREEFASAVRRLRLLREAHETR